MVSVSTTERYCEFELAHVLSYRLKTKPKQTSLELFDGRRKILCWLTKTTKILSYLLSLLILETKQKKNN